VPSARPAMERLASGQTPVLTGRNGVPPPSGVALALHQRPLGGSEDGR